MKLRDLAPSRLEPGHAVALIIAISFVLRAGLAGVTGFSFDESYDVVAARSVALGYYDHPPLAMWLIASAVRLFGSEEISSSACRRFSCSVERRSSFTA